MKYGTCSMCGGQLCPVWFEEEEIKVVNSSIIHTGRKRIACSHLECSTCLHKECIDDTFDSKWN